MDMILLSMPDDFHQYNFINALKLFVVKQAANIFFPILMNQNRQYE